MLQGSCLRMSKRWWRWVKHTAAVAAVSPLGCIRIILFTLVLAVLIKSSPANATEGAIATLNRVSNEMARCARVSEDIGRFSPPVGYVEALQNESQRRALEIQRANPVAGVMSQPVSPPVGVTTSLADPVHRSYSERILALADDLARCGESHAARTEEARAALERVKGNSERPGDEVMARFMKAVENFQTERANLAKAIATIGNNRIVQGQVSWAIKKYFSGATAKQNY